MKLSRFRRSLIGMAAAVAFVVPMSAQTANRTSTAAPEEGYSLLDFGLFGGYQWFRDKKSSAHHFQDGAILGGRVSQEFSRFIGLEESFTVGFNDLELRPSAAAGGTLNPVNVGVRNYQFAVTPVFHFAPRSSRFRPFLLVGPAFVAYDPGDRNLFLPTSFAPVPELKASIGPALVYGGGVKYNATRHLGLRFDIGGLWTQTPHFNFPSEPARGISSVYIPRGGTEMAVRASVGIIFRTLYVEPPAPPAPPLPKVEAPKPQITVGGITGARDVCAGDDLRLGVDASGWPTDQTPTYAWLVNGQPAEGGTGPNFSLPTQGRTGAQTVTVQVSAGGVSQTSQPVTVSIKAPVPPTVQFSVNPSTVPAGTRIPLAATATGGGDCGGPVTIAYTASEGTVAGNQFDTGSLVFDTNRSKLQTKTVTLTATATDTKTGLTATATSNVTVTLAPEARRLDDIVFPSLSSRVNNCAKRVLLEVLTPLLRDDPNGQVVLIGHRDASERGRAGATVDQQRVLNAAAVLSAGTGICPQLELSRVKTDWVGTNQDSTPRPAFCGTSTAVRERRGSALREADARAQFRRVEIWFVPSGATMPASLANAKDAPADLIKARRCPK